MKKSLLFALTVMVLILSLSFSASAQTTIQFAHFYDPAAGPAHVMNIEWLERLVAAFEEENPDIQVEFEWIKWDEIDVRAVRDYRAGVAHDVMLTSPQLYGLHDATGSLMDIGSYIDEWPEERLADINWSPVWVSAYPYGVPLGIHTRAVAYRRDLYEEAGLNPDVTPGDPDELVEYAQKLTTDDVYGLGMYFGPVRATIELYFAPYLWHFDGHLWDPETKMADFATEAGIEATEFLYDLIYTHGVTPEWSISGTYDDVILLNFLEGRIAQAEGYGSYWIGPLEEQGWIEGLFPPTPEGETTVVDIFPTPTKDNAQFTNAWNISIHALSDKPDESFRFIEFLTQPEWLVDYPDAGLPALLSLWDSPELQTPFYQKWLAAAESGRPMPPTAHYGDLADTVAACLQQIFALGDPIPETLQQFQDEYNAHFGGE